jgi:hypothetical protein
MGSQRSNGAQGTRAGAEAARRAGDVILRAPVASRTGGVARNTAARIGIVVALGALASCSATRELEVVSRPPGAEVRVDDVVVGTTPLKLAFKDYGTRRVTLYVPGYLTHSELVELDPPWYATFPLDIFTEVLFPVGWHHVQRYEADLVAGTGSIATPELEDVLARAEALRRAGPEGPEPAKTVSPAIPPQR